MGGFRPQAWRTMVDAFAAGGAPAWGANGNRPTNVGHTFTETTTHRFDANGNLIREFSNRRVPGTSDRLAAFANRPAGGAATVEAVYLYGADGARVKKWVRASGLVESSVYIGQLYEHHRWRDVGDPTRRENGQVYVRDDQMIVAVIRRGDTHSRDGSPSIQHHLHDHLGSYALTVGGSTADAQTFVNREEYFAHGDTSFGSFGRKRYRFTGKERDEESGLCSHARRMYSTALCRWTTPDPAGAVDRHNLFEYARSNPVKFVDASGLAVREGLGAGARIVGEGAVESLANVEAGAAMAPAAEATAAASAANANLIALGETTLIFALFIVGMYFMIKPNLDYRDTAEGRARRDSYATDLYRQGLMTRHQMNEFRDSGRLQLTPIPSRCRPARACSDGFNSVANSRCTCSWRGLAREASDSWISSAREASTSRSTFALS